MILIAIGIAVLVALIFGPRWWIKRVMARHAGERADFPGTGGELAEHLLDQAEIEGVTVESVESGDHYDPAARAIRLSKANFNGRSITAAAIAAHEAGHAIQDAQGYAPLKARQKLAGYSILIERTGSVLLLATPAVFALTRAPALLFFELAAGFAIITSTVVIHTVTLPVEFDASFRRALPILEQHLKPEDMPAARQVLKAAAFTYVAAALVSLLDIARWIRILRF